ncbi:MAG: DNA alkylation repair protein [Cyanobacteria bacterium J06621_11]
MNQRNEPSPEPVNELKLSKRRELIAQLIGLFEQHSDPKTKAWFDNYLKGAIAYRGLKTPQVTKLVKAWYAQHSLACYSQQAQLSLCADLMAGTSDEDVFAEDKFAGTLYLQAFLLSKLDYSSLLKACDSWFQRGYFFDWSTTDWFCTRILDPTILNHGLGAAKVIARFRSSGNLWQRRASIVSFRRASRDPQYHPLIKQTIADLLPSDERFIQTGIGWLLADMSKPYPAEAEALFRQHFDQLSKEVIDRHAKHLPCHKALKQLKRTQLKRKQLKRKS